MAEPIITLRVDAEWTLTVAEVWPDGPPARIDASAVIEAFARHLNPSGLLHDWNLDFGIEVDVLAPNPNYVQAEAFFEKHAASPTIHSKDWWPS